VLPGVDADFLTREVRNIVAGSGPFELEDDRLVGPDLPGRGIACNAHQVVKFAH
jgi:hypothetical protein